MGKKRDTLRAEIGRIAAENTSLRNRVAALEGKFGIGANSPPARDRLHRVTVLQAEVGSITAENTSLQHELAVKPQRDALIAEATAVFGKATRELVRRLAAAQARQRDGGNHE